MNVPRFNGPFISKAGNLAKLGANRGGGSGSFFDMLPTAAVLACGATLPAALGTCLGYESVGFTASFGAYLVTITHADLPIKGGRSGLQRRFSCSVLGRFWVLRPVRVYGSSFPWPPLVPHGRLGRRSPIQVLDSPRPWPFWHC